MHPVMFVLALALLTASRTHSAEPSCPTLYQRYCSEHSYCLPHNSSCEILAYYPTEEDIALILQLHNNYRNIIAEGVDDMPPAANMMQMEWDDELAAVSQKYAQQCIYEHDKPQCRQVIGQSLAIQQLTGGHVVPQPDWSFAVDNWYAEIKYFDKKDIPHFKMPKSEAEETRHFTQVIWANTFRVGCGYVLYKTGNDFKNLIFTRLYVCDYGPAGNFYNDQVYEEGDSCSHCPANACCGKSCNDENNDFPGLCRRSDTNPPWYPPPESNLFYCTFQNDTDCDSYITGAYSWLIMGALSGNYISVVLKGGEDSTLVFKKPVQPKASSTFCVSILYRFGPDRDGDEDGGKAAVVVNVPQWSNTFSQTLNGFSSPARQQFSYYNLTMANALGQTSKISLNFQVPSDKPAQFFDVKSIIAVDGNCQ